MSTNKTVFASMEHYQKGGVDVIEGDVKHYVFSNLFEVAKKSMPFEKIVVAKNIEYVVEVVKSLNSSQYYINGHDEFMLVMQGTIEVEIFSPVNSFKSFPEQGAEIIDGQSVNRRIGKITASRGHLLLLPEKHIYKIYSKGEGVFLLQTILGKHSIEKWSDICLT
jgi:hypothetical protein